MLKAIDGHLIRNGVSGKALPKKVEEYEKALKEYASPHNGKLLGMFRDIYDELHIAGYYRGNLHSVETVRGALKNRQVLYRITRIELSPPFPPMSFTCRPSQRPAQSSPGDPHTMNTVEQSVAYFREGFSCSQAILAAFGPALGLDREPALRLGDPFGGGMGGRGETCGAVTGAFMVIGLKYGRTRAHDKEAKANTQRLAQRFVERFTSQNATIVCRELLGCDISTPVGMRQARDREIFRTLCPRLVQNAAEILQDIL